VGGIGPTFNHILLSGSCVMAVGTLVLYGFGFADISNPIERLWASLFHAISAYNNAGFGLWSDSLMRYRDNTVVNGVIAFLIVTGGLGWRVIKVEPTPAPGRKTKGDPNRYVGRPVAGDDRHSYFVAPNAGKQVLAIDLKQPAGQQLLQRLMGELKAKLMSEGKLRYQNSGTSEYLSPAYLMAHLIPLLNLYDFADDAGLRAGAEALLHLHLTHLALNAHQGYILEPHARVHGLQYTSGSNVACAGQFLTWIYFGHMDLPDEVLIGKGRDIIHPALSEFRPLPTLHDLANGGGKAAFP
jgi:hypothetical protein